MTGANAALEKVSGACYIFRMLIGWLSRGRIIGPILG